MRPHAPRHDDLFQRRIAGTLTDAVDRTFDLSGPGFDRGERVGHREPEVVMAVRAEHDAVGVRNTLAHGAEHGSVLDGQRIAHRVREIDRRRPRGDRRLDHPAQEFEIGPRRVLGRELDVVGVATGPLHRLACPLETLVATQPQLALEVQVGSGDEDVDPRSRRRSHRLAGEVDVPVVTAGQRGDDGPADTLGDRPDGPPVALGRVREPCFDHVHPERVQLAGETHLFLGRH